MIYLGLSPSVRISGTGFNGGWRPDFRLALGARSVLLTLGFVHVMVSV